MSWYQTLFEEEEEVVQNTVAICFDDALVLLTVSEDETVEGSIVLQPNVMKNLDERMDDIMEKFLLMQNDELDQIYEVYIGDRTFVTLDPTYGFVVFAKYESDFLADSFVFNTKQFVEFIKEWTANVAHMKIHELQTSCSPLHPCAHDGCFNCKT